MDDSHDVTLHALENMISIMVFSEHSYRFGVYKQWEADFLRHLLGYTTFEEERDFNDGCNRNLRLCEDHNSVECRIGKKMTALLRHNSPLKHEMYPNGAVELCHVFDHCPPAVNAYEQMEFGRYFAAFIQGNKEQRYFVEVELKDDWFLSSDRLPWKIYIGCNQGHSTGIVRPIESSHQLTKGERVTNPHGDPVLIVREYFMLSTSQQEDLRAQGITRHVWEKYPLAGHSVLFFTRSCENRSDDSIRQELPLH